MQLSGHGVEPVAGLVHLLREVGDDAVEGDACLVHDGHDVDDAVGGLWES